MAKSKQSKIASAASVTSALSQARGAVVVDYTGLTVKESQELRRSLREQGVAFEAMKKTILKRSLAEAGLTDVPTEGLTGSLALATSGTDEVTPAKLTVAFAKTHEKLKVLAGLLERRLIPASEVTALATLPGKQELLGQVVGSIAAPLSGLVNVLQGNLRGLVQVLKARSEKMPS